MKENYPFPEREPKPPRKEEWGEVRPSSPEEPKKSLEAEKGWSPESNDFWNLGVVTLEATKAEEEDRVHLEGSTWDPDRFKSEVNEYAKERGIDNESAVAEASYLLAGKPEDLEKMRDLLEQHIPIAKANLLVETRNILKEGGDGKEVWKRIKLQQRLDKLQAALKEKK